MYVSVSTCCIYCVCFLCVCMAYVPVCSSGWFPCQSESIYVQYLRVQVSVWLCLCALCGVWSNFDGCFVQVYLCAFVYLCVCALIEVQGWIRQRYNAGSRAVLPYSSGWSIDEGTYIKFENKAWGHLTWLLYLSAFLSFQARKHRMAFLITVNSERSACAQRWERGSTWEIRLGPCFGRSGIKGNEA